MITIIAGLTVAISGCSYFGLTPDISEYIDPAQESVQDNEALASYIEEVKPVLEAYYTDGRTLKSAGVKGNEVNVEIDLGDSPDPYEDFEKLMVDQPDLQDQSHFHRTEDCDSLWRTGR